MTKELPPKETEAKQLAKTSKMHTFIGIFVGLVIAWLMRPSFLGTQIPLGNYITQNGG